MRACMHACVRACVCMCFYFVRLIFLFLCSSFLLSDAMGANNLWMDYVFDFSLLPRLVWLQKDDWLLQSVPWSHHAHSSLPGTYVYFR